MKTLGQIAYEATAGAGRFEWLDLVKHDREVWEAAAQAVRGAVIEECAKRIEGEYGGAVAYSGEWESRIDEVKAAVNRDLVDSIRALKGKK